MSGSHQVRDVEASISYPTAGQPLLPRYLFLIYLTPKSSAIFLTTSTGSQSLQGAQPWNARAVTDSW